MTNRIIARLSKREESRRNDPLVPGQAADWLVTHRSPGGKESTEVMDVPLCMVSRNWLQNIQVVFLLTAGQKLKRKL